VQVVHEFVTLRYKNVQGVHEFVTLPFQKRAGSVTKMDPRRPFFSFLLPLSFFCSLWGVLLLSPPGRQSASEKPREYWLEAMDRKNLKRRHRLAVQLLNAMGVDHIRLTALGRGQYHYSGWNLPKVDGNGGLPRSVQGIIQLR
jgi:hypothetical protein